MQFRFYARKLLSVSGILAGGVFVLVNLQLMLRGPILFKFSEIGSEKSLKLVDDLQPPLLGRRHLVSSQGKESIKDTTIPPEADRPWYMKRGQLRPSSCDRNEETGERDTVLFPEEAKGDRMIQQLGFVPPADELVDQEDPDTPLKKILLWNGSSQWGGMRPGRGTFMKQECPVSTCAISTSRKDSGNADLIIFKDHFIMPGHDRPSHQLWMMYMLECPMHTQGFKKHPAVFNWTATYRSDSTVVTPYERWDYYNPNVKSLPQEINYAANKTGKVAWFVSNCAAKNGRLDYARKLGKYISVDIYGTCGEHKCPRTNGDCFKVLDTHYKFYLAFENSNCIDYITEKFYVNGLGHKVIPIVMGARPEDYERSAPHNSFIHVDNYDSPQALAEYLQKLDENDDLYNEYFKWKGTGEFIDTKFFCRLCALLHDSKDRGTGGHYEDLNEWWRGQGSCINGSWRKLAKLLAAAKTKENKEGKKVEKIEEREDVP